MTLRRSSRPTLPRSRTIQLPQYLAAQSSGSRMRCREQLSYYLAYTVTTPLVLATQQVRRRLNSSNLYLGNMPLVLPPTSSTFQTPDAGTQALGCSHTALLWGKIRLLLLLAHPSVKTCRIRPGLDISADGSREFCQDESLICWPPGPHIDLVHVLFSTLSGVWPLSKSESLVLAS